MERERKRERVLNYEMVFLRNIEHLDLPRNENECFESVPPFTTQISPPPPPKVPFMSSSLEVCM
jgi:hypothetical protein